VAVLETDGQYRRPPKQQPIRPAFHLLEPYENTAAQGVKAKGIAPGAPLAAQLGIDKVRLNEIDRRAAEAREDA